MAGGGGLFSPKPCSTAHIITVDGKLVTRALSNAFLHGITHANVLNIAEAASLPYQERAFTPEEALNAAEAFITSATNFVLPVTKIDGLPVGNGKPGALPLRLRELYIEHKLANAI